MGSAPIPFGAAKAAPPECPLPGHVIGQPTTALGAAELEVP